MNNQVHIQIDCHSSGNLTLKERKGNGCWSDIKEDGLFANSKSSEFYQKVALKLACYAKNGIRVISYNDTNII